MPRCVEFLQTDEAMAVLSLLCTDKKDIDKMSRFERFALTCDSLHLLIGHELRKKWIELIELDMGKKLNLNDLRSRDEQKRIWRQLHAEYGFCENDEKMHQTVESKEFTVSLRSTESLLLSALNGIENNKTKDVCISLPELLEVTGGIRQAKLANTVEAVCDYCLSKKISEIFIDVSALPFVSPDPYHAELAYKKISSGENYNQAELSVLMLWLTSSISRKISPRFLIKPSADNAEAILEYLEAFGGEGELRILIDLSHKGGLMYFAKLCAQKNISSEITVPEEMNIKDVKEAIGVLLSVLPTSRIKLSRSLTGEQGTEVLNKAICALLCELCDGCEDAEASLRSILE